MWIIRYTTCCWNKQHTITINQKRVTGTKVEAGYFSFIQYPDISYVDYMLPTYIACDFYYLSFDFLKGFHNDLLGWECCYPKRGFLDWVFCYSLEIFFNQIDILFPHQISRFWVFQTLQLSLINLSNNFTYRNATKFIFKKKSYIWGHVWKPSCLRTVYKIS